MTTTPPTEYEMRDTCAPTPGSPESLASYIKELVDRPHDYGTCVYAMSLAATAAFNYAADKLGVTGFQASCADLDIIRRTRHIEGPFILLEAEKMCFPQYSLPGKLAEAMAGWREWVGKECAKKLATSGGKAHPEVLAHWEKLATTTPTEEPKP